MTHVADTVHDILARLSGRRSFPDDISLGLGPCGTGGLGLDSLDRIVVVQRLEESFGIEISDDDFTRDEMNTPGGIVAYVEGRLGVNRRWIVGHNGKGWLYADTPDGSSLPEGERDRWKAAGWLSRHVEEAIALAPALDAYRAAQTKEQEATALERLDAAKRGLA